MQGGLVEIICASQYNGTFQTGAIARYNLGVDVGFRDKENSAGILLSGNVDGLSSTIIRLLQVMKMSIKAFHLPVLEDKAYPENSSISQ